MSISCDNKIISIQILYRKEKLMKNDAIKQTIYVNLKGEFGKD